MKDNKIYSKSVKIGDTKVNTTLNSSMIEDIKNYKSPFITEDDIKNMYKPKKITEFIKPTNKQEFIMFLEQKTESKYYGVHWEKRGNEHWILYIPGCDWVEDSMDLTKDGVVKISYNQSLYSNTTKIFETTYEDFAENYDKTLR